ncbi:uncharacterized protein EKO05_0006179 [Ascochyta rabiei]|uniref:uncharacterized protein n=1 Tax=Didymella rabiei TaxID=5454 RepID=UPI002209FD53|nr:uncharacterized protein EKO05_0006179 [Ascochyta rabiei]UPX15740.1 hypothetical protein EKO05_0006179 [Ascochyta rabiei]
MGASESLTELTTSRSAFDIAQICQSALNEQPTTTLKNKATAVLKQYTHEEVFIHLQNDEYLKALV